MLKKGKWRKRNKENHTRCIKSFRCVCRCNCRIFQVQGCSVLIFTEEFYFSIFKTFEKLQYITKGYYFRRISGFSFQQQNCYSTTDLFLVLLFRTTSEYFVLFTETDLGLLQHSRWSTLSAQPLTIIAKRSILDVAGALDPPLV